MAKHDDAEHQALQIITEYESKGILQSDLWRELKASSREGSRISLKLLKKGLIERKRELSDGRWTYRLFSKRRPIAIDSILDLPCITCSEILKCSLGGTVSPISCKKLSFWLQSMVE